MMQGLVCYWKQDLSCKWIDMNKGIIVLLLVGLMGIFNRCKVPEIQKSTTSPIGSPPIESVPINDTEWLKVFEQKVTEYMMEHEVTAADTYKEQLANKTCAVPSQKPETDRVGNEAFYSSFRKGVLMMGKVHKCGHCPENHISTASAFVISGDGICATNYHVFKSYDPSSPNEYITYFVMDSEQKIYPVKAVLAASKHDDLAIFRIDPGDVKLHPLALGKQKAPGASIHLISHPDHRFYTYTSGQINRHYMKPGTTKIRQSISAEFAKGSSGAPIMDDFGNVVGIVAGTQNIYYDPNGEIYQATIKEIIPVSRLKELIN